MTDNSSQLDRLDPTVAPGRDTPAVLGTELPARCECRALRQQLHVMQQRDDFQRDYLTRVIADLAAATRRLAAIEARNERTTT